MEVETVVRVWVGRGKSGHGKALVLRGRAKLGSRRQAQTGGDLKKKSSHFLPQTFSLSGCVK